MRLGSERKCKLINSSLFRLCATQQLYEQVSCDEPDTEDTTLVERDKIVWESPALSSSNKIVGNRVSSGGKSELKAHEEDIKVGISRNISVNISLSLVGRENC